MDKKNYYKSLGLKGKHRSASTYGSSDELKENNLN
jgi:hypothetical protein